MAHVAYANSTVLDRLLIRPRIYGTFDVQFGPMGFLEPMRPLLWYADQWWCPWVAIVTYLVMVKVLLIFTRGTTRKYTLLTVVHNALVALESLYMFWTLMREVFRYVTTNGLGYWGLYCDPHHLLDSDSDLRFYQSLFYLGKFHELFDTVVLVLRGRSPSALQLFHHTVMLLVTYYNRWPFLVPAMWLSVALNEVVHVFMYSYFALQALGIQIEWVRRWITSGQIIQFWIILLHALPWPYFQHHYGCLGHWQSWLWVFIPVLLINLMFVEFYVSQYLRGAKPSKSVKNE